MRTLATIALALAAAASFAVAETPAPAPASGTPLDWREGRPWADVVAEATAAGKPIFIDFFATWCGPCKMLDAQVYNQPAVMAELAKLVTYKVDVDQEPFKPLAKQFGVKAMPTMVLCRPDGTEIDRFLGFRPAEEFLATVVDYIAGRNTLSDLQARVAATPDDPELLGRLGAKHSERGEVEPARTALTRVLELDPANAAGHAAPALQALAEMEAMARDYPAAVAHLQRLLATFPDAVDRGEVLGFTAWAQGRAGDLPGQTATFRELLKLNPDDVRTLNALAWSLSEQKQGLEEATTHALRAAELSGDDPEVCDTVAVVYYARGMTAEALSWIDKAIAKDPQNDAFRQRREVMVTETSGK